MNSEPLNEQESAKPEPFPPVTVPKTTVPVVSAAKTQSEPQPTQVTRAAMAWVATIVALVLLVLLIIFISQNQGPATVQFLGFQGEIGQGIALLIAAVAGGALVATAAGVRIRQLRARARKAHKTNRP